MPDSPPGASPLLRKVTGGATLNLNVRWEGAMEVPVISPLRARRTVGAALLAVAALLPASAIAGADDRVPIGGGAGIVIDTDTYCTLTAIGNDQDRRADRLHLCALWRTGRPGVGRGRRGPGAIGTMVASNDGLDYAVIRFDPAKVRPVSNWNGFKIDGIGPDPSFGQVACKLGRTTGYSLRCDLGAG